MRWEDNYTVCAVAEIKKQLASHNRASVDFARKCNTATAAKYGRKCNTAAAVEHQIEENGDILTKFVSVDIKKNEVANHDK